MNCAYTIKWGKTKSIFVTVISYFITCNNYNALFQVIDLHDMQPENALEWCHLLPDVVFRVLVCGGDGTVGWVLNAIENLKLKVW